MPGPIHRRHQSFGARHFPFVDAPVQAGGDEIARHAEERKTALEYCSRVLLKIVEEQKKKLLARKNLKERLHMKMVQSLPANFGVVLANSFHRLADQCF